MEYVFHLTIRHLFGVFPVVVLLYLVVHLFVPVLFIFFCSLNHSDAEILYALFSFCSIGRCGYFLNAFLSLLPSSPCGPQYATNINKNNVSIGFRHSHQTLQTGAGVICKRHRKKQRFDHELSQATGLPYAVNPLSQDPAVHG